MPTEAEWAELEAKVRVHEQIRAQREKEGILHAEEMGYDCGKNGPNATNSHFSIFGKREWTKAWELGKKRAEAEESSPPGDKGSR